MTVVSPSGHLLHNLLLFGRLLRAAGLAVSPSRMTDLAQALRYVDIGRRADFYYATRAFLVHKQEDLALFDHAFALFWQAAARGRPLTMAATTAGATRPLLSAPSFPRPNQSEPPADPTDDLLLEVQRAFSAQEALRQKDFALLTSEEISAIKHLMAGIAWQLGRRRSRRRQAGRGRAIDWRRSLRRNWRSGGELLQLARRKPKMKPRPLVIIADISGSMERYSRLLLHFIYSLVGGLAQPVEAFVFSTRLTRITRQLQTRDVARALGEVGQTVPDWSGGTRIGEAIKQFNFAWGRRVLSRGAVVLLISDGWDRGDPALLGREMARLQRSCHRLIWLNPLLGSPQYEPLTRGMVAALPHIDDFLPVHNLDSLAKLADHLAMLGRRERE